MQNSAKPKGVSKRMVFKMASFFQESPRQTKPKKGPKRKVHEFRPFLCEFWCFSLGKKARFTCSGMPLGKVHELTFLWFGLPGPLLKVFETRYLGTRLFWNPFG